MEILFRKSTLLKFGSPVWICTPPPAKAELFLKIKFANMINIINNKEIIPELIQSECNPDEIFRSVYYLLKNPEIIETQLSKVKLTINELKSSSSSSEEASKVLLSYLS